MYSGSGNLYVSCIRPMTTCMGARPRLAYFACTLQFGWCICMANPESRVDSAYKHVANEARPMVHVAGVYIKDHVHNIISKMPPFCSKFARACILWCCSTVPLSVWNFGKPGDCLSSRTLAQQLVELLLIAQSQSKPRALEGGTL